MLSAAPPAGGLRCRVFRVNGHDIKKLADAGSVTPDGRPVVVLCDTDAARGIDILKKRAPKMHYVRFASTEEKSWYAEALEQLCGAKAPLTPPPDSITRGQALPPRGEGKREGPEIVSRVHAKNLVKWAADKPKVLVLSADLTSSTEIDLFRDTYPDRFLSMGIAEQNMLSWASGLAREGSFPLSTPSRSLYIEGHSIRSPCPCPIPTCLSA